MKRQTKVSAWQGGALRTVRKGPGLADQHNHTRTSTPLHCGTHSLSLSDTPRVAMPDLPGHRQELQDAEEHSQTLLLPLSGRERRVTSCLVSTGVSPRIRTHGPLSLIPDTSWNLHSKVLCPESHPVGPVWTDVVRISITD